MQGASPLASPALNRLRHLQSLPLWYPAGACPRRHLLSLPLWYPVGGLPALPPAYPAFSLPFCPPSPRPPSRREGGDFFVFLCKGLRPLHPRHLTACGTYRTCQAGAQRGGLPRRHWLDLPIRHSTGACLRHRQFGAKPIEQPFYWRCRQPRRGGTGGEELRRLRWSSPPGQDEQVPRGGKPPCAPPPGITAAGSVNAAGVQAPGMQGAKPLA